MWNRATGRITTLIKDPATSPPLPRDYPYTDTYYRVFLNNPPGMPRGTLIVGEFHVHVEPLGPSGDLDNWAADANKVPGVHIDSAGRMSTYGNYKRGVWNSDLPAGCR